MAYGAKHFNEHDEYKAGDRVQVTATVVLTGFIVATDSETHAMLLDSPAFHQPQWISEDQLQSVAIKEFNHASYDRS